LDYYFLLILVFLLDLNLLFKQIKFKSKYFILEYQIIRTALF
jgi:hypothetical protein